ncbi:MULTISPECIES: recombinase family protein [Listeria]|uniref:recombinase family protein n=1 Tax=Listeria TaxID=1637 RepID=UPI000B58D775|nr:MULTISPECIES: recombinase family protein [Listeria]
MSKIGYIRISSTDQNTARQMAQLEHCEKIFVDKVSGQNKNRPELENMLAYIRESDIVVVTELDRLGRNNADLTDIMDQIKQRGATLEVLNLPQLNGIQDENLRLLLNNLIIELYKYQAESERKRIKERQYQGIQLAKKNGKYKGRKRKFEQDDPRLLLAIELYMAKKEDGTFRYSLRDVEKRTAIARRTLLRYFSELGISRKK